MSLADRIVDVDARPKFKSDAAYNTYLWAVVDRREKVMDEAARKRQEKERRKPNAYQCAREGCPVQATSKMALRKCGGPCPTHYKPSYCSRECQQVVSLEIRPGSYFMTVDMPFFRTGGYTSQNASRWIRLLLMKPRRVPLPQRTAMPRAT